MDVQFSRAPEPTVSRALLLPLVLLALTLWPAAGCGSADAPAPPPAATPIDLGLLSSTRPTTVPVPFANPLAGPAVITQVEADGAFSIDAASLPARAIAGTSVELGVACVRPQAGTLAGGVTLRYVNELESADVRHEILAMGERVEWVVTPPTLDFGTVDPGDSVDRTVTVRNASRLSAVLVTSARFSHPPFTVVGNPFPLALDPGGSAVLTLRYAPTVEGNDSGFADLGPTDAGGPARIPIQARTTGEPAEVVWDLGEHALTSAVTPVLTVDVPAAAISLTVEGLGASGDVLGLGELIGPDGTVYENLALSGAYIWIPGAEVFATTVPNTDRPGVQLVPGGGTYAFRIRSLNGVSTSVRVRAIVEVRPVGAPIDNVLDLNVWLANGIAPTATTAAGDPRLQAILDRVDAILAVRGVRLGDVHYYDVANPAYDDVGTEAEFGQLLRTTSAATADRLNLFFVRVALGGPVVGAAATIAGPRRNGTTLSGVMSIYEGGLGTATIGLIAAHEIGHFLGLYHTVESNGDHDFIDDTADCPPSSSSADCPVVGGGLLMHWQAVGGTDLSPAQAAVIRGHPLVDPAATGSPKPLPATAATLSAADRGDLARLGEAWCGTCAPDARGAPWKGR